METARLEGFDVLILDTAGRLAHRRKPMDGGRATSAPSPSRRDAAVADAMTGQDAVNVAKAFNEPLASPASC